MCLWWWFGAQYIVNTYAKPEGNEWDLFPAASFEPVPEKQQIQRAFVLFGNRHNFRS